MAVLAAALITGIDMNQNSDLLFTVQLASPVNDPSPETFGPYDASLTDVLLNVALRDDIRAWLEENWEITFGVLDTFRLVHLVSPL